MGQFLLTAITVHSRAFYDLEELLVINYTSHNGNFCFSLIAIATVVVVDEMLVKKHCRSVSHCLLPIISCYISACFMLHCYDSANC